MIYSLLFCIGGLIIMLFLPPSYVISLKRLEKIGYRQKVYLLMIIFAYLSIIFEIGEGISYVLKNQITFNISWYIHWATTYGVYFTVIYYFYIYLNLNKPKNWVDIIWNKKNFSFINAWTIFVAIAYIVIFAYISPIKIDSKIFEFVPKKYVWTILVTMGVYGVYLLYMIREYWKLNEKNRISKLCIMLFTIMGMLTTTLLQIVISKYSFLALGLYLGVMLLYFLIENVDLIIAEELILVKRNIEKSSNAKLDFLYNMSHDIRSPMNAIVELSKSLREIEEFNEENIKADIKSIKFSCNNLVEIVNNILDVNKIASGQEDLQLKEYNLNKLLADMPYVIETRIGSKPIKLEFDIVQSIASKLIGDTTKLYRVIMNILTNSVKYTEVGKIKLTIKGSINGDIQNLSMRISDTGYGIKKEDFDKMFTKFNRLDDATDNAIEGTGLGLVITKKYIDSMGGKIWFESEYGAGTIFFIELPQKIVDKTPLSEAVEGNENKKIDIIDLSNNRVLIVDDNTLNIKVTKKLLEKYNIEVDSVKTGEDCVFKIKSGEKYNLILLDDVLPDIGGLELVNIIKNIGAFEIPPVIAYTANVMNGIREEYLAHGFDEYISKPMDIYHFDSVIKKYLKKS